MKYAMRKTHKRETHVNSQQRTPTIIKGRYTGIEKKTDKTQHNDNAQGIYKTY